MIKVAIPNKGGLSDPTFDLLQACGYNVAKGGGRLTSEDTAHDITFYYLRPKDIPTYLAHGMVDAGITGQDFVAERGAEVPEVLALNYGASRLCVAVPRESSAASFADLKGLRFATSFPQLTRAALADCEPAIVQLDGAVEVSIGLGVADAIVDLVETGRTLKEAGLRLLGDPIFRSTAALFASPAMAEDDTVVALANRCKGRMVAADHLMVEYDAPQAALERACKLTPGVESPTLAPLAAEGWHSVKALVKRDEAEAIMDALYALGCRGVVLTTIESARL